jgi:hypothetical protein
MDSKASRARVTLVWELRMSRALSFVNLHSTPVLVLDLCP